MYDFRTLSPIDFEELTRDLLQAESGLRFESFGAGRDLGIDFRYASGTGHTIVQAKRYVDRTADAIVRAAAAEREKVLRLTPERYIFVTSASLSPFLKKRIRKALADVPVSLPDILGREDLNNLLRCHPVIERQHFKLWLASTVVLERILRSGVYHRSLTEMESIRKAVPKFVQNASIGQAETILAKAGVVMIAGEPGVGKSTLARMLVWLHAEQGWNVYVVDDLREAFEVAVIDEKRVIFFDDFLGQVELSGDHIRSTDQRFSAFLQRIRDNKNLRLVLTTRSYLLHQAQAVSSRLSDPTLRAKQMVLNVGFYTRGMRAKILYNHIFFSDLSSLEVAELLRDSFFLQVIDHDNFNPRIIDLLTASDYLAVSGRPIREVVLSTLDNPDQLWAIPYRRHIGPEARTLLMSLFFNAENTPVSVLRDTYVRLLPAMGCAVPAAGHADSFRSALREVEGSAVSVVDGTVRFSNPGVRDFLRQVVLDDGLLGLIVGAVGSHRELDRCRGEAHAAGHGVGASAEAWGAAVTRVSGRRAVDVLASLRLTVGIHGLAPTEEIVETAAALSAALVPGEHDGTSVDLFSQLLDELSSTKLPPVPKQCVRTRVREALAEMMRGYGDALTIDDFGSLSSWISKIDSGGDPADVAFKAALASYAENVGDALVDIDGVGELDEFSAQIRGLLGDHGIHEPKLEMRLQSRMDLLLEREEEEEDLYSERGTELGGPPLTDDEQINSMFGGLRDR